MFAGLNLKQLEAFYWVAMLGGFSAAAERLNTTQPGISMRLRELEDRLGTPVFSRTARGSRLTPKGRELLRLVEQLVEIDREWHSRLATTSALTGLVRVGAADTIAMTMLPGLLEKLAEQHPDIDVELFVDLSINLHARLQDGGIDVAFMVGEMGLPGFASRTLGAVENAWMASPSLRLPRRTLSAADLADLPVFTHSRGSHLHRTVMDWFAAAGSRPARLHGCNSLAMMIRMTVAGLGISVLPVPLLAGELAAKQIRRLAVDVPLPPNRFVVAYASTPVQPAVRAIVELAVADSLRSPIFERGSPGRRRADRIRS
jgi:DNA-binding transcriptional LysR family regulator